MRTLYCCTLRARCSGDSALLAMLSVIVPTFQKPSPPLFISVFFLVVVDCSSYKLYFFPSFRQARLSALLFTQRFSIDFERFFPHFISPPLSPVAPFPPSFSRYVSSSNALSFPIEVLNPRESFGNKGTIEFYRPSARSPRICFRTPRFSPSRSF